MPINGQRKKYQLKWNHRNELNIMKEADNIYSILLYIKYNVHPEEIKSCSIWMDGKVLE